MKEDSKKYFCSLSKDILEVKNNNNLTDGEKKLTLKKLEDLWNFLEESNNIKISIEEVLEKFNCFEE